MAVTTELVELLGDGLVRRRVAPNGNGQQQAARYSAERRQVAGQPQLTSWGDRQRQVVRGGAGQRRLARSGARGRRPGVVREWGSRAGA
ncbi:hypothetical protein [Actinoplanes sp. RD1]|uniref:hypothetical protein n=1 Tax=Actinoplanes sp. RD1 TaxID=3064538 RepID=UPI0027416C99|nr:hypothetical protein [Actinoplanes sp. RD1]